MVQMLYTASPSDPLPYGKKVVLKAKPGLWFA